MVFHNPLKKTVRNATAGPEQCQRSFVSLLCGNEFTKKEEINCLFFSLLAIAGFI